MSPQRSAHLLILTAVMGYTVLSFWSARPALAVGDVSYTVREGDTPASVAGALKMPLFDLLAQIGGMFVPGTAITVCPPGTQEAALKSEYIEFYKVRPADVQPNETWVNVCRALSDQKLDPEEIADFNSMPRQYHLVQAGDTLSTVAQLYDASLKPLARFAKTTPAVLISRWNRLAEVQGLAEGRLLTVGWQEPRAGERIAYPLIAKMIASVEADMNAEGLITSRGAQFFNPKVSYQLYARKEGQTLEELVAQCNGVVDVAALRKANGLEANEMPAVGQPIFVPTAASAFAGSAAVYKAYAREGAVLRTGPTTLAAGRAQTAGVELWIFENPWVHDPHWRAVMTVEKDRPWAWIREEHLKFDEARRRFYATGPGPKQPKELEPFHPTLIVSASSLPEPVNSVAKQRALKLALWFAANSVPYVMGGETPRQIDCSGLVWYCFTREGVWDRGTERDAARTQANWGRRVGDLKPADRLYWEYGRLGGAIDHTGLYLGGGWDVEATPRHVQLRSFNSRRAHLVKAMRDAPY